VILSAGLILAVGPVATVAPVPPGVASTILIGCSLLLAIDLMRALDFDGYLVGIVLLGVAVWVGYMSYTDPSARAYDAFDQFSYVRFIEQNASLPELKYCRICHHPPLYYLVAALWVQLRVIPLFLLSYGQSLQVLGLLIWFGFILFAILTARRYLQSRCVLYLAAAITVFWPYGIMSSVRLGNDGLMAGLMSGAVYFMIRWFEDRRRMALTWATLLSGLALLTKSSAYAVVTTLLLLLAWRSRRTIWGRSGLKRPAGVVGFLGGCALLGAYNKLRSGQRSGCQSLLGTACDALKGGQYFAGNAPINYLYFDLPSFVSEPFLHVYRPETGPDYFWNSLLKSSLFGTYSGVVDPRFAEPPNSTLALVISVLLLGMAAYVMMGLASLNLERIRRYRVLLLFAGASVVFLAGFRAIIPLAHHADFRFVLPLLVPGSVVYALTVNRFREKSRTLELFGYGLAVAFILATMALFAPWQAPEAKHVQLDPTHGCEVTHAQTLGPRWLATVTPHTKSSSSDTNRPTAQATISRRREPLNSHGMSATSLASRSLRGGATGPRLKDGCSMAALGQVMAGPELGGLELSAGAVGNGGGLARNVRAGSDGSGGSGGAASRDGSAWGGLFLSAASAASSSACLSSSGATASSTAASIAYRISCRTSTISLRASSCCSALVS
jgi:hypothetical protein